MSNSTKIFNVEEVTGKEHSALETTAAEALIKAPTGDIARQIETNVEKVKAAAQQAANTIETNAEKEKAGAQQAAASAALQAADSAKTIARQIETNAEQAAQQAANFAKTIGEEYTAVGTEYVEQVKALAQSAIETLQPYLPLSVPKLPEGTKINTESQSSSGDIPASLESGLHIVNSTTTTKGGGED